MGVGTRQRLRHLSRGHQLLDLLQFGQLDAFGGRRRHRLRR
jgi:hypothetical protein